MRAVLLWTLSVALLSATASGHADGEEAQPEKPRILHYLRTIWYPIENKPKAYPLGKRLREQIASEKWTEAVKTADALTRVIPKNLPDYEADSPWEWRASIAELCLFGGDRDGALRRLNTVFKANPRRGKGPGRSGPRQIAAYVMARAKAETGDFAGAINWQKAAPGEYWSGCGNCSEGQELRIKPILETWKCAQLPYGTAVASLEKLRSGGFVPYRARLMKADEAAKEQNQALQDEVALALGELHLRNGNTTVARVELRKAAKSDLTLRYLARTRLAQLGVD